MLAQAQLSNVVHLVALAHSVLACSWRRASRMPASRTASTATTVSMISPSVSSGPSSAGPTAAEVMTALVAAAAGPSASGLATAADPPLEVRIVHTARACAHVNAAAHVLTDGRGQQACRPPPLNTQDMRLGGMAEDVTDAPAVLAVPGTQQRPNPSAFDTILPALRAEDALYVSSETAPWLRTTWECELAEATTTLAMRISLLFLPELGMACCGFSCLVASSGGGGCGGTSPLFFGGGGRPRPPRIWDPDCVDVSGERQRGVADRRWSGRGAADDCGPALAASTPVAKAAAATRHAKVATLRLVLAMLGASEPAVRLDFSLV